VQEADDEEWGSANATGGKTGECKNAIECGKWGHPSSRHSCDGSAPRNALAPITQHAGKRTRPERLFAQPMHWVRVGL
jgi:hypothetical protein